MNIPILSFSNTFYLTLTMLEKDKKEIHINYDFLNKNLNNILIICLILILSIIIELEMGKLFILLIFFINILIDNNLINKNLKNFKEYLENKFFYFLGVFLIIQIYLRESKYIKGFLIFIMMSIIITLTILEYKTKNLNEIIKYKNNIQNFLISSLIVILLLCWGEYGKEPNVKYIKLFCRK